MELRLEPFSESMLSGTIVRWLKNEGDRFQVDEPLLEVETDKAIVQVPAPAEGVLVKICADVGDDAPVGSLLALVQPSDDAEPLLGPAPEEEAGGQGRRGSGAPLEDSRLSGTAHPEAGGRPAFPGGVRTGLSRIPASLAARRVAAELGIPLSEIWDAQGGTGPEGMISVDDVHNFAGGIAGAKPTRDAGSVRGGGASLGDEGPSSENEGILLEERILFRGRRRVIAENLLGTPARKPQALQAWDIRASLASAPSVLPHHQFVR